MSSPREVRQRIAHARVARGMSQNDVEKLMGAPGSGIMSGAEKGPKTRDNGVPSETLLRIATALHVKPLWLLTGEGPMEEEAAPDPLPRRSEAIRIAREGGISDVAIERVIARAHIDPEQRTALWWLKAFDREHVTLEEEGTHPMSVAAPSSKPVSSAPRTMVVKR